MRAEGRPDNEKRNERRFEIEIATFLACD